LAIARESKASLRRGLKLDGIAIQLSFKNPSRNPSKIASEVARHVANLGDFVFCDSRGQPTRTLHIHVMQNLVSLLHEMSISGRHTEVPVLPAKNLRPRLASLGCLKCRHR
jgi:hypothetical protein